MEPKTQRSCFDGRRGKVLAAPAGPVGLRDDGYHLMPGFDDPLEITTHVEQVWVAGREMSLENRQSRLFEKYDGRPRGPMARKH